MFFLKNIAKYLITFSVLVIFVESQVVRYDNYRLYQVHPETSSQIQVLRQLYSLDTALIFIGLPNSVNQSFQIIVGPQNELNFTSFLNTNQIYYVLQEKNIQAIIDGENSTMTRALRNGYNWYTYQQLEDTYEWLESLATKYPETVELIEAGQSYEGRKILGVKVSFGSDNKGIFFEGGIHAREWIAPATVTYMLNEILTNDDPAVRSVIDNFDWYIFPHVNPDGYVYSHRTDRLWRKTRSPYDNDCYGADPNRNFDIDWNKEGANSDPCSKTFAGSEAFSEIEMKTFSDFIMSLKGKIHTYISFHAFSQMLLFPYGYKSELASNYHDLLEIAKVTVEALEQSYDTKYIFGDIYNTIYPTSGGSVDWVYDKVGVRLCFAYELRPSHSSSHGFFLPSDQIIPTGEETFNSILALVSHAETLGYYDN